MDNSLLFSKYIFDELQKEGYFEHKVYPLVAQANTDYPYVVFDKTITPVYTKFCPVENIVRVEFRVYDDDYVTSLELANHVRNLFENKLYSDEDFRITKAQIELIDEDFVEDAYVQILVFEFTID